MAPDAAVLAAAREFSAAIRGSAPAAASAGAGGSGQQPQAGGEASSSAVLEPQTPAEEEFRRRHQGVRRGWELSEAFPSPLVVQAYMQPQARLRSATALASLREHAAASLPPSVSKG